MFNISHPFVCEGRLNQEYFIHIVLLLSQRNFCNEIVKLKNFCQVRVRQAQGQNVHPFKSYLMYPPQTQTEEQESVS